MRVTAWLLLLIMTVSALPPPIAMADDSAGPQDPLAPLKSICLETANLRISPVTPDGKYRLYVLLAEKEGDVPNAFDCSAYGVGPIAAKDHPELARATGDKPCFTDAVLKDLEKVVALQKSTAYAAELAACEKTGTQLLSTQCATEVGCNGLRSMTTMLTGGSLKIATGLYDYIRGDVSENQKGCLSPRKDDCTQKLITGVLKDLWANVEGIGFLAQATWNGTRWVAKKGWEGVTWAGGKVASWFSSGDVQKVEDKSSEAALAAGRESESSVRQFLDHPGQYMKDLSVRIFNTIGDYLRENFREAWGKWKCASCDAVMDGICEIAGYLGGEVLLAFLTGATVNAASKATKLAKVAEVAERVASAAMKYRAVRLAVAGAEGVAKIVLYLPQKILALANKTPGIKQYLHLTEQAFLRGLRGKPVVIEISAAISEEVSIELLTKDIVPPVAQPGALRPGFPPHGAGPASATAWGEDLARLAIFESNDQYLSLQEFARYDAEVRAYSGAKNVPELKFRVNPNGNIQVNGGQAMIEDRALSYPTLEMAPVTKETTATGILEKQFPGAKPQPLITAEGKEAKGGFQRVYVTPPEVSALGGKPSVLKVVDPAEARKVLGAAATDAEVTEYILKASQLDDAYYNFLKKLMQESGTPPAFRLPARKRISPTIVEVERMDAPTISELRRQKSPLLDRCKTQLDRYIRIMGGVYVAMDLAYRKRYGKSETLRAVFSKGADGERRMLPLGPDMNKPNIKLTAECEIQPIDQ